MKTFFNILLHEFNKELKNWSLDQGMIGNLFNHENNHSSCVFIYFMSLLSEVKKNDVDLMKVKYNTLEFTMISYAPHEHKDYFMEHFELAQKKYLSLLKLVARFKWKRAKLNVKTDLCGNELNVNSENCLELLQDGSKYYFGISDLINICKNALLNISYSMFSEPKMPLNPYTNREFERSHLYAIYWKIKKSNYKMPIYIQLFYDVFFNIKTLIFKYEHLLRNLYIEDFIKTSPSIELRTRILTMIRNLKTYGELHIDPKFPTNILINAMKPFLRLYYISHYSLAQNDEYFGSTVLLRNKFKQFCLYNPMFGRKLIKKKANVLDNNAPTKFKVTYQTRYIPFHKIKIDGLPEPDQSPRHNLDVPNSLLPLMRRTENRLFTIADNTQENESVESEYSSDSDDEEEIEVIANHNHYNNDHVANRRREEQSTQSLFEVRTTQTIPNQESMSNTSVRSRVRQRPNDQSITDSLQNTFITQRTRLNTHYDESLHNTSSEEEIEEEEEESHEENMEFSRLLNTLLDDINSENPTRRSSITSQNEENEEVSSNSDFGLD